MKVLVACEESQAVCKAFREKGHEAYSCDIQECSGGHPEWHIKQDVLPLLNGDCEFVSADGQTHSIKGKWDLIIAHPPCTFLTVTGNRWFNVERYGERRQKPTDIWTNHPKPDFKPPCKRGAPCHDAAPRGSRTGTQALKNAKEKGVIPKLLCEHIVDVCEKYI